MMDWYDSGWMHSGLWMFFMILFWGGLIAVGVWAVARLTRSGAPMASTETPRQILDRRFASGELDAEQYAQARHILEGRSVDSPPRT